MTMTPGQAITALDQFLKWLNAVPTTWYERYISGREDVVRPRLSTVPGNEQEQIAWPAENLYNAQVAWDVLLSAGTYLDEFPFIVAGTAEGTSQTIRPVNTKTVAAVREFLAKVAGTLGYDIPESTGVEKAIPAWKIAVGILAGLAVVGGAYYAYIKISAPRSEPMQLPPLRRQRRPQYSN
jgi:hypothetical protein